MEGASRTAFRLPLDLFTLGLLALSLAANVYLGLQLVKRPALAQRQIPTPVIGTVVSDFVARDLQGNERSFGAGDTSLNTVYYIFTPSCPWCARNLENIRALTAAAGRTYRVVAVSLDPKVDSYLTTNEIDFPVFINPTSATVKTYGLGSVPQTIVVSPDGQVLHHWKGAYGPNLLAEVSDALAVQLPGLVEPTSKPN